MKSLYDISGDLFALEQLLEEVEGDLSDETTEAAIDAWFAELSEDRDRKIDGYCSLIRNYEAMVAARKAEASRMRELASADENKAARLKGRLQAFFEAHGIDKVVTDRFTVAVQNNGGKEPVILADAYEDDPALLPLQFQKHTVTANKDLIRDYLVALGPLRDEVGEIAHLGERGRHLRIK